MFDSTPPSVLVIMCNRANGTNNQGENFVSATTPGNLLIGQSGGATAVINASLVGAVEAALGESRIDGIYGTHYGIEGLLKEDLHAKDAIYTALKIGRAHV